MTTEKPRWNDLLETIRKTVMVPINPAGWPFIAAFAVGAVLLALLAEPLGWIGLVLTLWCLYFFRDPHRVTPVRDGLVIAPGCGRVVGVTRNTALPIELDQATDGGANFTRISIFLSVFDVHVQRVPIDGEVVQTAYRPGAFLNAALDKASTDNEMSATLLRVKRGERDVEVAFVQIAGWVARRIVNNLAAGQIVRAGQRMGLIRFGSRVDVYVPDDCVPLVAPGQTTIEGETVIADFNATESPREGEVR